MTLTERISLVQARKKWQLWAAAFLTVAATGSAVSAVMTHSVISILSAGVVAVCMMFQWTIFFIFQAKEEVYTVMREQMDHPDGAGAQ
ncbi:MAG: hypothetical protein JRG91_02095 [Deltaproteobacteria bacterium]|nr:hypothetical protein [Deltaproteobacteria bacterium]